MTNALLIHRFVSLGVKHNDPGHPLKTIVGAAGNRAPTFTVFDAGLSSAVATALVRRAQAHPIKLPRHAAIQGDALGAVW